ncbi:MAG: hypothetical protein R3219_03915 [Hydrogenovibrio sp.]|nr:hypothetical protein [Hydrogenovibrio sp.]
MKKLIAFNQVRNLNFISLIGFMLIAFSPMPAVAQPSEQPAAAAPASKSYPLKCVVVKGTASTEGVSKAFARQMAIRDGLKLASMQNNVQVSSSQEVKNYVMTGDSTRFTTHSKVSQFTILSEGMKPLGSEQFDENGQPIEDAKSTTYQVVMKVCLTEDPQACNNVPGNHYQPKLAIAQVVTTDQYGGRDISNLLHGYQIELERRMRDKGYRNQVMLQTGGTVFLDSSAMTTPNLSKDVLQPIREQTGAQYVLLTVIRSLSRQNEDDPRWNKIKRFYNQEVKPNARYIESDVYLVDLTTDQQVFHKRIGFDIKGEVTVGRDRPFGTNAFFATNTGMAFHAMLEQETREVNDYLHCQRMKTQVIDIRNDEYILYLSEEAGAQVGDQLAVYHSFGSNVRYQGVDLGLDSKPAGFLKIERIQSKFAVAKLVAKNGLIQVGDEVRAW